MPLVNLPRQCQFLKMKSDDSVPFGASLQNLGRSAMIFRASIPLRPPSCINREKQTVQIPSAGRK
jgi:hypothetical protein